MEPVRAIAAEEIDVAGIRKKMKLSQGKANPQLVGEILERKLRT